MAYRFFGFFAACATAREALIDDALARWPLARGKSISAPFTGIGLSFPDYERGATDEEVERLEAPLNTIEEDLAEFSRRWPGLTFVWMQADCSGGTCFYEGFTCRDGEVLSRHPYGRTLSPLLAALGVQTGPDEIFEPFARGYFYDAPSLPSALDHSYWH
jgi:hypothetical protein